MNYELILLIGTASVIAFIHTALGPDHYIPFVAMAKAGRWSRARTVFITSVCGLGHILSSVIIAAVAIALGWSSGRLEGFEGGRGSVAAWLLFSFGAVYFIWGVKQAIRNKPHTHFHVHSDYVVHSHPHVHAGRHVHMHSGDGAVFKPWLLFLVFVFGPCEPLIPLVIYAVAGTGIYGAAAVMLVFATVTVASMLLFVLAALSGLDLFDFTGFERFSHAVAGAAISLCGIAVFLGM